MVRLAREPRRGPDAKRSSSLGEHASRASSGAGGRTRRPPESSRSDSRPARASGSAGRRRGRLLEDLRGRSQVFIFVPESLLLVKGARRVGALISTPSPPRSTRVRRRRSRDAGGVAPAQRAAGGGQERGEPAALDPWDAQFARVAAELGRRRRDLVENSRAGFAAGGGALAPAGESLTICAWSRNWKESGSTRRPCSRSCAAAARRGRPRSLALRSPSRRPQVPGDRAGWRSPSPVAADRPDRDRWSGVRPRGVPARRPRPAALRLAGGTARRRPCAAPCGAAARGGAHRPTGPALPRRRHERAGRLAPPTTGAHARHRGSGRHHDDEPPLLHR